MENCYLDGRAATLVQQREACSRLRLSRSCSRWPAYAPRSWASVAKPCERLVENLARSLVATPQIFCSDLEELWEACTLPRVHDGAMIASGVESLVYKGRKDAAGQQKRLIGAAALVFGHSSLFINRGTKTEMVPRALGGHTALRSLPTTYVSQASCIAIQPSR